MFNRTASATVLAARRQNVPRALPLSQSYRLSVVSPQSPLQDSAFLQVSRSIMTPASPSMFFTPCSPLIMSPTQRMQNLTQCLTANMPTEIVYPSLGQVASAADGISSFLDLYRARASDDAVLNKVKSPTSRDSAEWIALEDIADTPSRPRRRGTVRRSRSLSDLQRGIAITSDNVHTGPARAATVEENKHTAAHARSHSDTPAVLAARGPAPAELRRRIGVRPLELRLAPRPPPTMPLPSPPPPSALLRVKSPLPPTLVVPRLPQAPAYVPAAAPRHAPLKSPRAPYWVKTATKAHVPPKTPRTMRSERRQGWGAWTVGSMGQVADQLKEA